MVSTSLKSLTQQVAWPPEWIPHPFVWRNYPEAATFLPLVRYSLNSLTITVLFVVGTLLSCPLIAYAFARIRFPVTGLVVRRPDRHDYVAGGGASDPHLSHVPSSWDSSILTCRWSCPPSSDHHFSFSCCGSISAPFPRNLPTQPAWMARRKSVSFTGFSCRCQDRPWPSLPFLLWQSQWNDFMDPLIYLNKEEMRTLALGLYYFRRVPRHDELGADDGGRDYDDHSHS